MVASPDRIPKIAGSVAVLICLGFAAFTHHAWEDYLITFRASLNLATGHGLVYQTGERVHSFTSPLGTLLPALFAVDGGPAIEIRALWWFRLTSATALGISVWLAAREFSRSGLAPWVSAVACSLWILDPKIVDFSTNGMEAALLILFLVLTWRALINGANLWPLALGFAGLQWTRPDGFGLYGALVLAWLCWGEKSATTSTRKSWRAIVRATALGVMLYLPWVVFAWLYYGSPIPHTIVAKQFPHPLIATIYGLALYPWRLLFGHVALHDIFMPAYFFFGGWPHGLVWFARLLGTGAALAWVWPAIKSPGRIASAALFIGGFYLEYIPGSPWYFPAWQVLGCIGWAYLLDALCAKAGLAGKFQKNLPPIIRITALVLVIIQAGLLLSVSWQMRCQQTLIENKHRAEIGLWLKTHATPHDRVYLEPLGYIGFYSGLKMLDNPGLCAPEVVAVRHAGQTKHSQIIQALKPEWLVLRPDQVQTINEEAAKLLEQDYRLARVFDAREQVNAIEFLPGRGYLDFDARFLVYTRLNANTAHASQ